MTPVTGYKTTRRHVPLPTGLKAMIMSVMFNIPMPAHPASYTMGTGSFPGVKRPGRGVNHPPQLAPRLKKE